VYALPAFVMLTGSVGLGLLLGLEYLRRVRSKPAVIGFHLLFGAASVEVMAMLIRGAPNSASLAAGPLLKAAAALLAFALLSGLVAPMIGRRSRGTMNGALIVHVSAAAAGCILCVLWFVRAG
jgi:hypothetical protein